MNAGSLTDLDMVGVNKKSSFRKNILTLAVVQALACGSGAVYAANITVNSNGDTVSTDNLCTLREALQAANTDAVVDTCTAGSGADTITFDNTLSGSTVTLGGTALGITSELTIDGDLDNDGNPDITLDAASNSRVIAITPKGSMPVTLDGLTITNGNVTAFPYAGGGVLCYASNGLTDNCALTISNSVITRNSAGSGGGIRNGYNNTVLNNTRVTNNTATAGSGGGIETQYVGDLQISDSTITGNTSASRRGGGIFSMSDNVVVSNTIVSGNTASLAGGGIYSKAATSVSLTDSTVSGNSVTYGRGAGIYAYDGNVALTRSTLSGNNASSTNSVVRPATGGGLSAYSANIVLSNSTVSGNTATDGGGGLYNYSGNVTIDNSTIVNNNSTATAGGGLNFNNANANAALTIRNSVLAGNMNNGVNSDCISGNPPTITETNNLVTDGGTACGLTPVSTADPMLDVLADNGGPTQTHLPKSGSPVIDAGDNTNCGTGKTIAVDQRGMARDDGACDIGAVETVLPVASVQFDSTAITVDEGAGNVSITLTRSGDTASAISVDYATADGTATASSDYTGGMNSLSFAAGETSQTLTFSITDDTNIEGDETFSVTLSNAQVVSGSAQAALGTNETTTVTITDNDVATTGSTASNDGVLGIGFVSPWMLLLGLTGWLRRLFIRS